MAQHDPKPTVNSSIADTLRAMAKGTFKVCWLGGTSGWALSPDEVAACDAGAAAWEIVQQIGPLLERALQSCEEYDNLDAAADRIREAQTLVHPDR